MRKGISVLRWNGATVRGAGRTSIDAALCSEVASTMTVKAFAAALGIPTRQCLVIVHAHRWFQGSAGRMLLR